MVICSELSKTFFIFLCICVCSTVTATAFSSDSISCSTVLGKDVTLTKGGRFLGIKPPESKVEISLVTYDLSFTLANLGLADKNPQSTFVGKSVLLVGEGFGPLLSYMIKAGAKVTAVDPLYALKDTPRNDLEGVDASRLSMLSSIEEFLQTHGPYLRPGIAQSLPVENQSVDLRISHLVYNNFANEDETSTDFEALFQAIRESLRVLRPGGQSIDTFEETMLGADGREKIRSFLAGLEREGALRSFSFEEPRERAVQFRSENGSNVNTIPSHSMPISRLILRK